MKKFCSQCGQENLDDVKFCAKCGTPFFQDKITNSKIESTVSSVETMNNNERIRGNTSFFKSKLFLSCMIILLLGSIVGGGYYYYQQQQILLEQEAMQKASEERAAAEKRENELKEKEAKDRITNGIKAALTHLDHNETLLKELADKINSGNYDRSYFNAQRQTFLNELNRPVELIDTYMMNNDEVTKNEVKAMLELQRLRANMMYDGLNWDKSKFYIGGQYYDDYYAKLKSFKQKYNVE